MRFQRLLAVVILCSCFAPSTFCAEPVKGSPEGQFERRRRPPGMPPLPDINDKEHVKARNEERQRELKSDTDKLLALATELKQYVEKTNDSVLSVDVIRKAEEIEKLAKSVREKMKGH